jgi:hypothetical protein
MWDRASCGIVHHMWQNGTSVGFCYIFFLNIFFVVFGMNHEVGKTFVLVLA